MSTLRLDLRQPAPVRAPACVECGGPTRLVGIEPHPIKRDMELRTFECMACDSSNALVMPVGG